MNKFGLGDIVNFDGYEGIVIRTLDKALRVGIFLPHAHTICETDYSRVRLVRKAHYTEVSFNIGDKVKRKISNGFNDIDETGIIFSVDMGKPLPYMVGWEGGFSGAYSSKELEVV